MRDDDIKIEITRIKVRLEEIEKREERRDIEMGEIVRKLNDLKSGYDKLSTKFTFWNTLLFFTFTGAIGMMMKLIYEVLSKIGGIR